ncbi:unnamed protein product [Chrysodeixis includens]|uniref:Uncharacterized protein n=1 Tax=Chrysodeixis includens TaxID=689277 RepID=A0A9N8L598_CHRIL|nr:unnamed protein product [Chrysodeixis includens]
MYGMKSIIFLAALAVLAVSVSSEDTGVEEPVAVLSVDAGVEEPDFVDWEAFGIKGPSSVAREDVGFEELDSMAREDTDIEELDAVRQNLILGSIGSGNKRVLNKKYTRKAKKNTIQWQEITLRVSSHFRITAIRARDQSPSQGASARLRSGGIGQTHAKVRLQTAKGRGYNYLLEIWMKSIIFLAALAVLAVSVSSEDTGVEEPVAVLSVDAGVEEPDFVDWEAFGIKGPSSVAREDAGIEEPVAMRQNLILGSIGNGNRLLHRNNYVRRAQANAVQWQELTLRAASNVRITAIRAVELGASQGASARLLSGGIGQTHAKIRLQTARGRGYNYQVEIWGRLV